MATVAFKEKVSGQHCSIQPGDTLSNFRFQILRRLGIGVNLTIWLARDQEQDRYVSLKIAKSHPISFRGMRMILEHVFKESRPHPGKGHVMPLIDSFTHEAATGMHECLVFPMVGPAIGKVTWNFTLTMINMGMDLRVSQKTAKIQLSDLKSMLRQVLLGLDFLHKRGIVHNDMHPGSILVSIKAMHSIDKSEWEFLSGGPSSVNEDSGRDTRSCNIKYSANRFETYPSAISKISLRKGKTSLAAASFGKRKEAATSTFQAKHFSPPQPLDTFITLTDPLRVKIANMGNAFFVSNPPAKPATQTHLRSPEMILGHPVGEGQDIWGFGCLIFALITHQNLFAVKPFEYNPYDDEDHGIQNSDVVDDASETTTEMRIDSPVILTLPGLNNSYFQQFACRLGPLPSFILSESPKASQYFRKDGTAKPQDGSLPWTSLEDHFDQGDLSVNLSPAEKVAVLELIRDILRYEPEKRPTAWQLLRHPWFLNMGAGEK